MLPSPALQPTATQPPLHRSLPSDLLTLSDEDLTGELGCKTLQVQKQLQASCSWSAYAQVLPIYPRHCGLHSRGPLHELTLPHGS